MNSVVSFERFARPKAGTSLLVLMDLQQTWPQRHADERSFTNALVNCAIALANARKVRIPVAFARQVTVPTVFGEPLSVPAWISGFEPTRSDLVFDRELPSCYASPEFLHIVNDIGGHCVIAGLFGDSSCLATILDGFHRGHRFTYLTDASISNSCHGISAAAVHDVVMGVISRYGTLTSTQAWIRRNSKFMSGI